MEVYTHGIAGDTRSGPTGITTPDTWLESLESSLVINRFATRIFSGDYNVTLTRVRGASATDRDDVKSTNAGSPIIADSQNSKLSDREVIHGPLNINTGQYENVVSTGIIYGSSDDGINKNEFAYKKGGETFQDEV